MRPQSLIHPRAHRLTNTAIFAIPLVLAAITIAQSQPDSRNPTRDRQPPALKDDDEMQAPGVRSDGKARVRDDSPDNVRNMGGAMRMRCKMLMKMKVDPFDPAAVLVLEDDLQLTDEQAGQLRQILEDAISRSRQVLDERQREMLSGLSDTPATTMAMHRRMMRHGHGRQSGTTEQGTRKDGRSARRLEERPRSRCPMMKAMREMDGGGAGAGMPGDRKGIQQTVDVVLRDYEIDMPKELKPGIIRLRVRNGGEVAHNLEIEGQGIEEVFSEHLKPGESRTMHVHLRAGRYQVCCPVGDHAERGMEMQLVVSGSEGTDG